jgi:hypothetical protein
MKKYILVLLPLVMLGACKKDFEKLNTNPKLFPTVPGATLVTQAERQLSSAVTTSSVNNNVFRLVEQQWQETTYNDESLYNFDTRNINRQMWNSLYRDVLNNLQLAFCSRCCKSKFYCNSRYITGIFFLLFSYYFW